MYPAEPPMTPIVGPPSTTPPSPGSGARGARPATVAILALSVAVVVVVALLVSARGSLADVRAERARLATQVTRFEKAEARREAADEAIPNLERVADAVSVDDSGIDYSGDADSLDVSISYPDDDAIAWLGALLDDLGFSPAVVDRIGHTRALDGTQDADGDHVTATWTYHPDNGLAVVFSTDD